MSDPLTSVTAVRYWATLEACARAPGPPVTLSISSPWFRPDEGTAG
jgi:hypothetical protein